MGVAAVKRDWAETRVRRRKHAKKATAPRVTGGRRGQRDRGEETDSFRFATCIIIHGFIVYTSSLLAMAMEGCASALVYGSRLGRKEVVPSPPEVSDGVGRGSVLGPNDSANA